MTDLSYSTGTVSVAANGTVVTGTGLFFSNLRAFDFISIDNEPLTAALSITDETHLTIPPWQGGDKTDVTYVAYKLSPFRYVGAESAAEIDKVARFLNDQGVFYSVKSPLLEPDPSIGNDGDYALKTDAGAWQLWLREAGAWVLQPAPAGFSYRGNWDSGTAYVVNDRVSRGGTTYLAKAPSINQDPATDLAFTYWDGSGLRGATGPAPVIAGTSTSTVTAGIGARSFTTQAGITWLVGQRLRIFNSDSSIVLSGLIASYAGTALGVTIDYTIGIGSSNNWTLTITGEIGLQGVPGPQGNASTVPGPKGDTGDASTVPGPQGIQGDTGQGINPDQTGTLSGRATYDNQPKNFKYLVTDTSPFQLFIKASNTTADWAGPTYIGGQAAVGDMGLITDSVTDMYDYGSIAA